MLNLLFISQEYKLLFHPTSKLCLASDPNTGTSESRSIVMTKCKRNDNTQKWEFDNQNKKVLDKLNREHPLAFES